MQDMIEKGEEEMLTSAVDSAKLSGRFLGHSVMDLIHHREEEHSWLSSSSSQAPLSGPDTGGHRDTILLSLQGPRQRTEQLSHARQQMQLRMHTTSYIIGLGGETCIVR